MIDLRGVTVRYGEVLALNDVDLHVSPGTVCGLVGINGAGKSTLLKAVTGLARPHAGSIAVDGGSSAAARAAGLIGYMPQSEDVDWSFPVSVRDAVAMGRYARLGLTRRPRARDRAAVSDAIERVGLTDLAHRQIGRLSGGQRKRAFVARALAQQARLLLLDEPFAGVDRGTEEALTALLRELAADGCTVLVSTHDLNALPTLCDEVVLLRQRVLMQATPAEVLRPESLARAFGLDGDAA